MLKRTGLGMALTAWETYVEDRVQEVATVRLSGLADSDLGNFVKSRLDEEIKGLHNPISEKTLRILRDYAGKNLLPHWNWNHVDPDTAKRKLNGYLKLGGDVAPFTSQTVSDPRLFEMPTFHHG